MKRKNTPNVSASLYDGDFQLVYECVGELNCKFVLCSLMPPQSDAECFFREYGACRCPEAQHASIERLRAMITGEMKQRSEEKT